MEAYAGNEQKDRQAATVRVQCMFKAEIVSIPIQLISRNLLVTRYILHVTMLPYLITRARSAVVLISAVHAYQCHKEMLHLHSGVDDVLTEESFCW